MHTKCSIKFQVQARRTYIFLNITILKIILILLLLGVESLVTYSKSVGIQVLWWTPLQKNTVGNGSTYWIMMLQEQHIRLLPISQGRDLFLSQSHWIVFGMLIPMPHYLLGEEVAIAMRKVVGISAKTIGKQAGVVSYLVPEEIH